MRPRQSHSVLRRSVVLGVAVVTVGAGTLLGSSARAAASYYASPGGTGTDCTQASPCTLPTALSKGAAGDNVYLFANKGDYHFSSDVNMGAPVHLHGMGGLAHIVFAGGELRVIGGTADALSVENNTSQTTLALEDGATGDRLFVKGGSGHACYMRDATMTNSVCWAPKPGDVAIETDGSDTLRNVTAVGGSEAAILSYGRSSDCSCSNATVTLVNVIAWSHANGVDLEANSDGTATITMDVKYTNYTITGLTGSGSPGMTHINPDPTDQNVAPGFNNATAGDFREIPNSITVDAGQNSPANGTQDLAGNPRTVRGKTDIGAYELQPPDTVIWKSAVHPSSHSATFRFKAIGGPQEFACSLAHKGKTAAYKSCHQPKTYTGLAKGGYVFRVRALNRAGPDPTPASKSFTI